MNNVEQFKKIATELGELYEKKNTAYNNSFGDTYKKLGIISAVTRISDKYNRLCNLATNPNIENLGESLEDTLRDMASYCIMTAMELENAKPCAFDMQENVLKQGNPVTEDEVVLKDDTKILKGDVFECIEDVVMYDCDEVAYIKGKTYYSEFDECITDEQHDDKHYWTNSNGDYWRDYFRRI